MRPFHPDGTQSTSRRRVLAQLSLAPLGLAVPGLLTACSREPKCTDVSGLSPDDAKLRTEIAAYEERSPDAAKLCKDCAQYVAGPKDACGMCKVVKGPINPVGTCKLFVKRT
jgi:hypothetical protein